MEQSLIKKKTVTANIKLKREKQNFKTNQLLVEIV